MYSSTESHKQWSIFGFTAFLSLSTRGHGYNEIIPQQVFTVICSHLGLVVSSNHGFHVQSIGCKEKDRVAAKFVSLFLFLFYCTYLFFVISSIGSFILILLYSPSVTFLFSVHCFLNIIMCMSVYLIYCLFNFLIDKCNLYAQLRLRIDCEIIAYDHS